MEVYDIANLIIGLISDLFKIKKTVEAKQEAEYQTQILENEAKMAEEQAADERQSGIEEARKTRLKAILNMSEIKTDIATGNILLSSPTAINLVSDEKLNGELDALITLKNSEKKSENFIQQSQRYYQNAALKSFSGTNSYINSLATTSLTSASRINYFKKEYDKNNK